jgi:hypothetical protein
MWQLQTLLEAQPNSSKTCTKCGSIVEGDGQRDNDSHMAFSSNVLHKTAGCVVEGIGECPLHQLKSLLAQ